MMPGFAMAQLFHRSVNTLAHASIAAGLVAAAGTGYVAYMVDRGPLTTRQGIVIEQPVPFSHEHHVRGLGIDCRYCHTAVEQSSSAGIPPTATCMNCHKLIHANAPLLEPVRSSYRTGTPLRWARVHDLPDYVYFNHSIHVAKGVGCASCHGRVDGMPLMQQKVSLQMEWCLKCHRDPAAFVRPRSKVFDMEWKAEDQRTLGAQLVKEYQIRSQKDLLSCSTCHR